MSGRPDAVSSFLPLLKLNAIITRGLRGSSALLPRTTLLRDFVINVVWEEGVQPGIAMYAGDVQVLPQKALASKADLVQYSDRGGVSSFDECFEPVDGWQVQSPTGEQPRPAAGELLVSPRGGDPVSDTGNAGLLAVKHRNKTHGCVGRGVGDGHTEPFTGFPGAHWRSMNARPLASVKWFGTVVPAVIIGSWLASSTQAR